MLAAPDPGTRVTLSSEALRRARTSALKHGDAKMQRPLRPTADRTATCRDSAIFEFSEWTATQKGLDPWAVYGQIEKLVGVLLNSYGVGVRMPGFDKANQFSVRSLAPLPTLKSCLDWSLFSSSSSLISVGSVCTASISLVHCYVIWLCRFVLLAQRNFILPSCRAAAARRSCSSARRT